MGSLDEGEGPGPDQVVGVEMPGETRSRLAGQMAHQGEMSRHELVDVYRGSGHRPGIGPAQPGLSLRRPPGGPIGGRITQLAQLR